MSFLRPSRLVVVFALALVSLFWVGCGSLLDGGGGGNNTTEPRFITGTFKSERGKIFVFSNDSYKFYMSEEKMSSSQPFIDSKYEIKGNDIFFERDDGSLFAEAGKLAEDGQSFTWVEHPGETFRKQ